MFDRVFIFYFYRSRTEKARKKHNAALRGSDSLYTACVRDYAGERCLLYFEKTVKNRKSAIAYFVRNLIL